MKQIEPLRAQVRRHERQSGNISPGTGETSDNAGTEWIAAGGKHNWNFIRCPFSGKDRGSARRDDHIDFVLHQLHSKVGKTLEVAIRVKIFGFDSATLDVTQLAHPASIFFERAIPLCLR